MSTISIGDRFINVHNEHDGADPDDIGTSPFIDADGERITPAGNVWIVSYVVAQYATIVCELTGAAINPTLEELNDPALYRRTDTE